MIWYKGNVAVKVRELVKREQEKAFLQNRINFTVTPVCERAKRIICPPRLRTKPCIVKATSNGSEALRETIIASLVLTRYDWRIALHLLRTISSSRAVTVIEQRIMSRMACSRVMLQGKKVRK